MGHEGVQLRAAEHRQHVDRDALTRYAAATKDLANDEVMTELEVGYSARSTRDYTSTRDDILDHLLPVVTPVRAEQRARDLR